MEHSTLEVHWKVSKQAFTRGYYIYYIIQLQIISKISSEGYTLSVSHTFQKLEYFYWSPGHAKANKIVYFPLNFFTQAFI